ncbi:MAG: C39 family peptidase, partial [Oscillospiraceae bacterium]|nr:C39 family peptidase [Oscillospiraceae bacterium]
MLTQKGTQDLITNRILKADYQNPLVEMFLDVPLISQMPELPTGCEITSIAMMLEFSGADVSKIDLANEMPKSTEDPNIGFVGDPFTDFGWTIYPNALMNLVKKYAGSSIDLTGCHEKRLEEQILNEKPVVVWLSDMYTFSVHTLVMVGYDEFKYYFNDPWGNIKNLPIDKNEFIQKWNKQARRAISYLQRRKLMPYVIESDHCIFSMSDKNESVISVPDGATIIFKTKDCFANQIQSADVKFDTIDWNNINPATGPIDIEGANPGDILQVIIKDVTISNQSCMLTGKDMGLSGGRLQGTFLKIMPIIDGKVKFSDKISIPVRPMIGVIGVAPKDANINCGTPGLHGGNMDCAEITAGTTLYLPVNVIGAKLAMGDLHAVMGDGEVSVCGAEIPGEVTVEVHVLKNKSLPTPLLKTDTTLMTIASAITLNEAVNLAVLNAV